MKAGIKTTDLESPDGDVALDADKLGHIVAGDVLLGDGNLGVGDQRQGEVVGKGEEAGHHWRQIQPLALYRTIQNFVQNNRYSRTSEHSALGCLKM